MAVGWTTDTDDDGTGLTGTVRNQAWKQAMEDAVDALVGDWTAWTPTIGGSTSQSGQGYGAATVGRYKKTAKGILALGTITLTAVGTITGNVQIKGLPTASTATANRNAVLTIGYFNALNTNYTWLGGFLAPASTGITLQGLTAAASGTSNLAQANLTATTSIVFAIEYETDT